MRRSPAEILAITGAPATSAIFLLHRRTTRGSFPENKRPHRAGRQRRARWGPDGDQVRGDQVTAASSEPIAGPSSQFGLRAILCRFSACGAASTQSRLATKDRRAPSAAVACAGAILGLDICIACMVELCARCPMKRPAQPSRERLSTPVSAVRQAVVRVPRLPWHAGLRYRCRINLPDAGRPCRHRNRIAGSSRSGSGF